jgi:hypothetical protein
MGICQIVPGERIEAALSGKLAVITDIDGNAPALRAVLTDISLQGEIDHTCCLGDTNVRPDGGFASVDKQPTLD